MDKNKRIANLCAELFEALNKKNDPDLVYKVTRLFKPLETVYKKTRKRYTYIPRDPINKEKSMYINASNFMKKICNELCVDVPVLFQKEIAEIKLRNLNRYHHAEKSLKKPDNEKMKKLEKKIKEAEAELKELYSKTTTQAD